MSPLQQPGPDDLESFSAAVAHELRTPLAALSGEVDLALRRDRSPAGYRDALMRIATAIGELVELTCDLTFLGQSADAEPLRTKTARLDRSLVRLVERYASIADMVFAVWPAATVVNVVGDEALLTRALTFVVDHAVRHRRGSAQVQLRAASAEDPTTAPGHVDLIVEAAADAFWPQTWQCLVATPPGGDAVARLTAGPIRLRAAARIVSRCGGSLHAASADGSGGVHIRLRRPESA